MDKKVYVFHEYGAPEHYLGLDYLMSCRGYNIHYIAFTFVKPLIKALLKRNIKKAFFVMRDFYFVLAFFLCPSKLRSCAIVVGCAPMDWRILVLMRLSCKAHVIYHSSWANWSGDQYPKNVSFFKSYIQRKWSFFLKYQVDKFALVTPQTEQQLTHFHEVNSKNCKVVYHAFDETVFNTQSNLKDSKKHFIFVGRLVEEKGLDLVFDIAKNFLDCRFSIIGDGRLITEVTKKSISYQNVEYLGFIKNREELAELYRSADFILQPSLRTDDWEELFGIALVEAMACGVIPFASDHVGPQTLLANSFFGKNLFKEEDFVEKTTEVARYYIDNPEVIFDHQKSAIDLAKHYNRQSIAKIWHEIIEEI